MIVNKGIGVHNDLVKGGVVPGPDQVFQVNGAAVEPLIVNDIEGGDVVVLRALTDQFPHGLFYGSGLGDGDIVGGHHAADFIIGIGGDHPDLPGGLLTQVTGDQAAGLLGQLFQNFGCFIRIHAVQDCGGLVCREAGKHLLRLIAVGQDLCQTQGTQGQEQSQTLLRGELFQGLGNIIVVVVVQTLCQDSGIGSLMDQGQDLGCYCFVDKLMSSHHR